MYMYGRFDSSNDPFTNGEYALQQAVAECCGAEACFMDVGANIGDWTGNLITRILPTTHVIKFPTFILIEPSPVAAEILYQRFADTPCCVIVNCAVSSTSGTGSFFLDGASPLNRLLSDRDRLSTGQQLQMDPEEFLFVQVPVERVTEVVNRVSSPSQSIDLLKIDAEGSDFAVLQGALELLSADRIRVAQFEYNHRWLEWGFSLRDCFKLADDLDLYVVKVVQNGLIRFDSWHPELDRFFEANFAFVNPRIIDLGPLPQGQFSSRNVLKVSYPT